MPGRHWRRPQPDRRGHACRRSAQGPHRQGRAEYVSPLHCLILLQSLCSAIQMRCCSVSFGLQQACAVTVLRLGCVQVLWLNRGVRTAPCDVQCKHVLAHMRSCACPALSCPCVLRCRSTLRCFWPCPVACARRRCLKWSLQEVSSTHQNPLLKLSKWPLSHVLTRLLVPCSDGACPLGRRALLPKRSSPRQPSPVHAPAQGCLLPGSSAGLPGGGWRGLSWRR